MSFVIIRYSAGVGLWYLSAFYADEGRPTRVSTSGHRTRADAVAEFASWF